MKKRILSIVLAVAMVLSIMPFSAFASTIDLSTGKGDTASYYLKVPTAGTTDTGSIAWSSGVTDGNGIDVVRINNELFYKTGRKPTASDAYKQINYNYTTYVDTNHAGVDGTAINKDAVRYLAMRIKVDPGNQYAGLSISFNNEAYWLNLRRATFIDVKTRQDVTSNMIGENYFNGTFFPAEGFDGWVIWDMNSSFIADGPETAEQQKAYILDTYKGKFMYLLHGKGGNGSDCPHTSRLEEVEVSDWTDRNLYIGDVLFVENIDTFESVRLSCEETGHNFVSTGVVHQPTCEEQGYTEAACSFCDAEGMVDITEPTGHTWVQTGSVPATCLDPGTNSFACACGAAKEETGDPATGHKWVEVDNTPETCTKPGLIASECENCGEYDEKSIPATGIHDYKDGICTMCGEAEPSYNYVTGVAATPADNGISVSWNAFSGATAYFVRVSKEDGTPVKYIKTTNTTAFVPASAIEYNTAYNIDVIANVGGTYLSYDDAQTVVSTMIIADRVVGVKATVEGDNVVVSYEAVAGAQEYTVYIYNGDTLVTSKVSYDNSATFAGTELVAGANLTAKVAVKLNDAYAEEVEYVVAPFVAPVVNPALRLTNTGLSSITVEWDAISGVSTYFVKVTDKATGAIVKVVKVSGATTATIAKLAAGTEYDVSICAKVANTPVVYAAPIQATTTGLDTLALGTNVVDGEAKFTWTKPEGAVSYFVYILKDGTPVKSAKVADGNTTAFGVMLPKEAGTYTFGIIAKVVSGGTTTYTSMFTAGEATVG